MLRYYSYLHILEEKSQAKIANTKLKSFQFIKNDEMINRIVTWLIFILRKCCTRNRDAKSTDICEIKALLGILFIAGIKKADMRNIIEMWDNSNYIGVEVIYLTMCENHFQFLMRCCDDVWDREERRAFDKLALIRKIFEHFFFKFSKSFNPSGYMTIDSNLLLFEETVLFVNIFQVKLQSME